MKVCILRHFKGNINTGCELNNSRSFCEKLLTSDPGGQSINNLVVYDALLPEIWNFSWAQNAFSWR